VACVGKQSAAIDIGHVSVNSAREVPDSPLEAVMSGEVWQQVYGIALVEIKAAPHTLGVVNTRRMAERVAHE